MSRALRDAGVSWRACERCQARAWLLGRLAGHLDLCRNRTLELLELDDEELIAAVGGTGRGEVERDRAAFDPGRAREEALAAGVEAVCRCDSSYPRRLADAPAPPAMLFVAGGVDRLLELLEESPVAIVGARRASPYGLAVAAALAGDLARAGVTVVSGMADGVDSAAHRGALRAGGGTVAVVAASPERSYPSGARRLHAQIRDEGAVVSELAPGTAVRRWMFPARNRIIAAISAMTVVVEGRARSGALLTAGAAAGAGRVLGAVPGPVTSPLTAAPHELLRGGARLVAGAQDVLEALFGPGVTNTLAGPLQEVREARLGSDRLEPALAELLEALAEGHAAEVAVRRAGLTAERALAALASLELAGLIRRAPGGRYMVVP